ncbi:MAG: PQQ-like beta-propeller repeat protein [Planctomycetota bacterium]|nr:PQQ-like beta-propeller repeat protein [Planctomycetota bacterium]
MWRGPHGNGIADAPQSPPLRWSETENIVWKAPIPGKGHSSPIVVGEQVILTTAELDPPVQAVLSFDRKTGRQRWRSDVHRGGLATKGNIKTSHASSTVACDGERLIVNFFNDGAIFTTALDLEGKQLWQTRVSDYKLHQGFGSSPMLYDALAFVTVDSHAGGVVAALERATGDIAWQSPRPEKPNYPSAVVVHAAGRDQLVLQGCDLVSSFDPLSGRKLWEIEGATTECVTTLITDGERIFATGGYPRKHMQAVRADGSGETAWENKTEVYVPSMIARDGYLFAVQDGGIAHCYKSDTGDEQWKARLEGTFTASLVLVGDNLFATNESGQTFIFKASSKQFEQVALNKLGSDVFATPAICGDRIYMRVAAGAGDERREFLYCLGE